MSHPVRVVLVNDDPIQLRLMEQILRRGGLEPCGFTGAEAALQAMAGAPPPDLLVTDLHMPGIDGWRLCHLLRSPGFEAFRAMPILVVSATFAGDEVARITRELGADAFMGAPLDPGVFLERVQALVRGERPAEPLRVLVVEDSPTQSHLLARAFAARGHAVTRAASLREAREAWAAGPCDIAVIDYHLPDGEGDGLLEAFHAAHPDCVCLMMTTDPDPGLATGWMKLGAAACVRKPFEPDYLLDLCDLSRRQRSLLRVERLLELRTRELAASEAKFRSLVSSSGDPIFAFQADGAFLFVNEAFARRHGLPVEAFAGQDPAALLPPDEAARWAETVRRVLATGESLEVEEDLAGLSGESRWLATTASPIRDPLGRITAVACIAKDITRRRQAEQALRESEARFRRMVETAHEGIVFLDREGRVTFLNPHLAEMLGKAEAEILGRDLAEFAAPGQRGAYEFRRRQWELGQDGSFELGLAGPGGERRWVAISARALRDGAGEPAGAFAMLTDITERRRAEAALRESEEKFRHLAENSSDVIWHLDADYRFDYVSPADEWMRGFSASEVLGTTVWSILKPEGVEQVRSAHEGRLAREAQGRRTGTMRYELELACKGGGWIWTEINATAHHDPEGRLVGLHGVTRDISRRKQAEAEQARQEHQDRQLLKAESLGRMAGAIAHHFNNQLQSVMGNLDLAMAGPEASARHLTHALQAARRAAEVSGLLLTYLGHASDEQGPLDLAGACRRALPILQGSLPAGVGLEARLPEAGPAVRANETQLQQVLGNLVTNAWEATGGGSGMIGLRVRVASPASIPLLGRFPVGWQPRESLYAELEVSDEGHGIPPGDVEKLFDPFFSTRFTGRGLGLSVVLGIVKAHRGAIVVESEPGRGSRFRVFLPVHTVLPAPEPVPPEGPVPSGGAILVVDDEPQVLATTANLLGLNLEMEVLTACDGVDALQVFERHRGDIRCVLCDLTMPRMDGWETLAALRRLAPGLPVILTSGYDRARVMAGDHPERPQAFLGKPFDTPQLMEALRRALAGP